MSQKVYLHELRRNKDLALGEVARSVGIETRDLSRIERGKLPLDGDVCAKLATALGVTPEEIRAGVPDADEAAADEARFMDVITGMNAAQADAKAMGFGVGKGGRGEFLCPICKRGQLHYSVAGVNGHLWDLRSFPTQDPRARYICLFDDECEALP